MVEIKVFSATGLPPSAKNQEYLWPALFHLLAGDNIQFVITHLVWDTKLAKCRKQSCILDFYMFNKCSEENNLRSTLHSIPQKMKQPDGANDYMLPLIMFSKLRTVCTCEKLMDILDILIWQKRKHTDELSINTVQISVLSTQI